MFGSSPHSRHESVGGVTIIRTHIREIRSPSVAEEFGRELDDLLRSVLTPRFLLDLGRTEYLSSTGFAVLVSFYRKVADAGGVVKICGLDPNVRVGAEIIGLTRLVEIYDDEESALSSF
jgi:anti-anti-sigma factor